MDKTAKIDSAYRKLRQFQRWETTRHVPLPKDQYQVIYADPPWKYEHADHEGRMVEDHYPTMSTDEICALQINEICAPEAVLFLWATSPKLEEAMRVVRAWGFEYRTSLVWVKNSIGLGYYVRQQHELILIGRRGNFPVPIDSNRPASVQYAKRENHSSKPALFVSLIEQMYPGAKRIELFARTRREGWESWGNELS
jgi:N6-adenosine-specific RNA methylase IME4